jgi:hypothetical protein
MSGFGAPMQLQIGGTWFLRGLLNSGLNAKDKTLACNRHHVLSFTDTARYVEFISRNANIELKNLPKKVDVAYRGESQNLKFRHFKNKFFYHRAVQLLWLRS